MKQEKLIQVKNLKTFFYTEAGTVKAVNDISFDIYLEKNNIVLIQRSNKTFFNIDNFSMSGFVNDISEDLRDYLRRRGVKIYTSNYFKSIKPNWMS